MANHQQHFRAIRLPTIHLGGEGVDPSLDEHSVKVKLLSLNQSFQQRVEILSPEIHIHMHPVIKSLISLTNRTKPQQKGG